MLELYLVQPEAGPFLNCTPRSDVPNKCLERNQLTHASLLKSEHKVFYISVKETFTEREIHYLEFVVYKNACVLCCFCIMSFF